MSVETWEQDTEQAWGELHDRLVTWLGDRPEDQTVVIELAWPDDQRNGAAPYVQLHIEDGAFVHAEAVSNRFLDKQFRLDKGRRRSLRALGWQRPTEDVRNYWCAVEVPDDADALAGLLVQTLREVYGVVAPAFLVVSGFTDEGALPEGEPPLGLRPAAPSRPEIDVTVLPPGSPDDLRDLVAEVLQPVLDTEVEFDIDGDIPVPTGNTVVYVRVEEDAPCVRLFAPLLHDVRWTPRVGHALNDVNRRLRYAKVVHEQGYVVAHAFLPCMPFVPEQLRQALAGMTGMVHGLDDTLRKRIGGRLLSETADGEA